MKTNVEFYFVLFFKLYILLQKKNTISIKYDRVREQLGRIVRLPFIFLRYIAWKFGRIMLILFLINFLNVVKLMYFSKIYLLCLKTIFF